jgi:hypothetical protein
VPRQRQRGKGNVLPPFVPLTWETLNSMAYKKLPPSAAKALPYFLGKVKEPWRDPERYNVEFPFVYGEAECYGFTRPKFARAIRALIELGFIDGIDRGGLRGEGKGCSRFRLSRRWEAYGTVKFKVQRWETTQPRVKSPVTKRYLNKKQNVTYGKPGNGRIRNKTLPVGANS